MIELTEGVIIALLSILGGAFTALVVPLIKAKLDSRQSDAVIDQLEAMSDKDGAITIKNMMEVTRGLAEQVREMTDQIRVLTDRVGSLEADLDSANGKIRDHKKKITELTDLIRLKDILIKKAKEVIHKLVTAMARVNLTPDFFIPVDLQTPADHPVIPTKSDGD